MKKKAKKRARKSRSLMTIKEVDRVRLANANARITATATDLQLMQMGLRELMTTIVKAYDIPKGCEIDISTGKVRREDG